MALFGQSGVMPLGGDKRTGEVEATGQEMTSISNRIMGDAAYEMGGNDDLMCTVCSQGLSKGAIRLEEHPVVPGVAVCPRCLGSLLEESEKKEGQPQPLPLDEYCAWCGDDNGVQVFVCDEKDCGRAFCFGCVEKLGEGTAAELESSTDPWSCPCCDEHPLAGLQALYLHAERNPPLLARVLSRLATDDAVVSRPLPREERSVEGKADGKAEGKAEGKDGGGGDADRLTDADEGKGARARGEEDDAFDQELIDAACVVDREISSTLEQMEIAASKKRMTEISEEIRKGRPELSPEEFQDELSAEQQRVHEMWQYDLDALMEVQANVKDALADRGLSEAEITIRDARPTASGEGSEAGDVERGSKDGQDRRASGRGDYLTHVESTASGAGGAYDAANALLHKCNGLWKSALNKLAAIDDEDKSSGSNGSAAVDNAAAPSDGGGDDDVLDVSRSPVFDLRFFKNAARSANDLAGGSSMTGWTEESVAAGAERALEFFRKAQAIGVDSPSTEDVEGWGLTGEGAEQLGILIRWLKNQLVIYERAREESRAPPRFLGEEGDEGKHPPSNREALAKECCVLERQIKALNQYWDGERGQDAWASMSDAGLEAAWRRLRVELHATIRDAESIEPLLETGGAGGLDVRALQAEDLGTSAEAWITSTLKADRAKWRCSKAQAARMLKEAVAREGTVAVKERSEAEDSKEMATERRRAVGASSKPRRPQTSKTQRRPRPKASCASSRHDAKPPSLPGATKKIPAEGDGAPGSRKRTAVGGGRNVEKKDGVVDPAVGGVAGLAVAAADDSEGGRVMKTTSEGRRGDAAQAGKDGRDDEGFIDDSDVVPSADLLREEEGGGVVPNTLPSDGAAAPAYLSPKPPSPPRDNVGGHRGREPSPTPPLDNDGGGSGDGGGEFMAQTPLCSDASSPAVTPSAEGAPNEAVERGGLRDDGGVDRWLAGAESAVAGASNGIDHSSGGTVTGDGAGEVSKGGGGSNSSSSSVKNAAACSPSMLVGMLKSMGVVDEDIVKPEGRSELDRLLRESEGDGARAVQKYFERDTKTREKEKVRNARKASLRTRDGPLGAGCYVCESRLPGNWKRMRKLTKGERKWDNAGSRNGGCGNGGGSSSNSAALDLPGAHMSAPTDAVTASGNGSYSEDGQGRTTADRRFGGAADGKGKRAWGASSSRRRRKRGEKPRPKARMAHPREVVSGGGLPSSLWICARDGCLEVALDIGYTVEAVYPMEHVTWTAETECGPDRLARLPHGNSKEKSKLLGSKKSVPLPPAHHPEASTSPAPEGLDGDGGPDGGGKRGSELVLGSVGQSGNDKDMNATVGETVNKSGSSLEGAGESQAMEENAGIPAVEEVAGIPAVDEDMGIPAVEEDAGIPAVEEDAGIPAVEDAGIPAVDEDTRIPAVEEDAGIPAVDENPETKAADEEDIKVAQREAEVREACAVVLGNDRAPRWDKMPSVATGVAGAGTDRRSLSTVVGEVEGDNDASCRGGKGGKEGDSTDRRKDGSSAMIPIVVMDAEGAAERRLPGTDGSANSDVEEKTERDEGGRNCNTDADGDVEGDIDGIPATHKCAPHNHDSGGQTSVQRSADNRSRDEPAAVGAGGEKRACAGPGCSQEIESAVANGTDDSLCVQCLVASRTSEAPQEEVPAGIARGSSCERFGAVGGASGSLPVGDRASAFEGRDAVREEKTVEEGSARGQTAGRAEQPKEIVDLAFSDDDQDITPPQPSVCGARPPCSTSMAAAAITHLDKNGGEQQRASNDDGGDLRSCSSVVDKASLQRKSVSLQGFWNASTGGGGVSTTGGPSSSGVGGGRGRGKGSQPTTLAEEHRKRRGKGGSLASDVGTSATAAAAAAAVAGGSADEVATKDAMGEASAASAAGNPTPGEPLGEKNPSGEGGGGSKSSDDEDDSPIVRHVSRDKNRMLRRIGSDTSGLCSEDRNSNSSKSGGSDLDDSDYEIDDGDCSEGEGAEGSGSDDLTGFDPETLEIEEDEAGDSDDDDVVFQGVHQGRRREGPLDEKQEREVAGLREKEKERLKAIEERKFRSPPKRRIRRGLLQSPMSPMDVEVLDDSEHAHVLEVLPAEDGKSDAEVKAVTVAPFLGRHLYEHQIEGVQFMYDNLVVNVEQLRGGGDGAAGNGCILAHCMGLGKTLQAITIMHVLLTNEIVQEAATVRRSGGSGPVGDSSAGSDDVGSLPPPLSRSASGSTGSVSGSAAVSSSASASSKSVSETPVSFLRTCLVVVPKNVLRNWEEELKKWLKDFNRQGKVFVVDGGKWDERCSQMESWHARGGILVMSYTVFRIMTSLASEDGERCRKFLLDPGPDVVVADEAHLLKNEEAKVTVAIKKLRTKRRVALTGSPLQNNLVEYYTMVDFVRKGMLGDLNRFKSYFEAPILNGMLVDSSPHDVKLTASRIGNRTLLMPSGRSHGRSHVLYETLRGFVQRKDVTVMAKTLPPHVNKEEIVLTVALTRRQKNLTQKIFREAKRFDSQGLLMRVLTSLQLAWTHPVVYEGDRAKKIARAAAAEQSWEPDFLSTTERSPKRLKPSPVAKDERVEGDNVGSTEKRLSASSAGVDVSPPGPTPPASGPAAVGNASQGYYKDRSEVTLPEGSIDRGANRGLSESKGDAAYPAAAAGSATSQNAPVAGDGSATKPNPASRGIHGGPVSGAARPQDVLACVSTSKGSDNPGGSGSTVNTTYIVSSSGNGSSALGPSFAREISAKRPRLEGLGEYSTGGACAGREGGREGTIAAEKCDAKRSSGVAGAACWTRATGPTSAQGLVWDLTTSLKRKEIYGAVGRKKQGSAGSEVLRPLEDGVDMGESAKMVIAIEIIARAIRHGDKVLVFSQRTPVLDFFERVFMTPGFGGTVKTPPPAPPYSPFSWSPSAWGPWRRGKHYFRLDGSTSSTKRQMMIDEFNRRGNKTTRVFLLSTRAGNMGINLVAANRVILMDTSWNPANDLQAMFRCYRLGQTKPVEVYRLVMGRSLENKMHNKQITKHALAKRVVDAKNPGRKLTMADQTLNLEAEYSRYENNPHEGGSVAAAEAAGMLGMSGTVPLVVTEQDAQTLAVDNDRLADILDIEEAEDGGEGLAPSPIMALSGGEKGDDEAAVEDPVLKHLLKEFHPNFITSWVANKRLLEDDPLDKLDEAGKEEAKRQYNEELKLQEQEDRQLKAIATFQGLVRQRRSQGVEPGVVPAACRTVPLPFSRQQQQRHVFQQQPARNEITQQEHRDRLRTALREVRERYHRELLDGLEQHSPQQQRSHQPVADLPRRRVDGVEKQQQQQGPRQQEAPPSAAPRAESAAPLSPRDLVAGTARTVLNGVARAAAGVANVFSGVGGNRGVGSGANGDSGSDLGGSRDGSLRKLEPKTSSAQDKAGEAGSG